AVLGAVAKPVHDRPAEVNTRGTAGRRPVAHETDGRVGLKGPTARAAPGLHGVAGVDLDDASGSALTARAGSRIASRPRRGAPLCPAEPDCPALGTAAR